MEKLDLRKTYKHLYAASAKSITVVDMPPLKFARIDGEIEPGCSPASSPAFQQSMEALYGISYTLKFASKNRTDQPLDYTVMGLEALWWVVDGEFDIRRPDNWCWTAMVLQPEHITPQMFQEALEGLRKKKPGLALEKVRFETFHEGLSVQILHIGPYSEEPATLDRMRAFAEENGLRMRGLHHEIYLSDPRRVAPEKLKTVLRHPVENA